MAGTLSRMDGRNLRKGDGIVNQDKSMANFGGHTAKNGHTLGALAGPPTQSVWPECGCWLVAL